VLIGYLLCRIEDDATTTLVSQHGDIVEGKRIVEQDDFDFPYSLHTDDGCKVATFAEGRIGYREWLGVAADWTPFTHSMISTTTTQTSL